MTGEDWRGRRGPVRPGGCADRRVLAMYGQRLKQKSAVVSIHRSFSQAWPCSTPCGYRRRPAGLRSKRSAAVGVALLGFGASGGAATPGRFFSCSFIAHSGLIPEGSGTKLDGLQLHGLPSVSTGFGMFTCSQACWKLKSSIPQKSIIILNHPSLSNSDCSNRIVLSFAARIIQSYFKKVKKEWENRHSFCYGIILAQAAAVLLVWPRSKKIMEIRPEITIPDYLKKRNGNIVGRKLR